MIKVTRVQPPPPAPTFTVEGLTGKDLERIRHALRANSTKLLNQDAPSAAREYLDLADKLKEVGP